MMLPDKVESEEETKKEDSQDQLALLSSIFHMLNQSGKEGQSPIKILKQKIDEYERTIARLKADNAALKKALAQQLEKADRDRD